MDPAVFCSIWGFKTGGICDSIACRVAVRRARWTEVSFFFLTGGLSCILPVGLGSFCRHFRGWPLWMSVSADSSDGSSNACRHDMCASFESCCRLQWQTLQSRSLCVRISFSHFSIHSRGYFPAWVYSRSLPWQTLQVLKLGIALGYSSSFLTLCSTLLSVPEGVFHRRYLLMSSPTDSSGFQLHPWTSFTFCTPYFPFLEVSSLSSFCLKSSLAGSPVSRPGRRPWIILAWWIFFFEAACWCASGSL
jgi:hypothetical protein